MPLGSTPGAARCPVCPTAVVPATDLTAPLSFLACISILFVALHATADPRVFEDEAGWLDPSSVVIRDSDLAFTDAPSAYFCNEAFYLITRLDNGWVLTTGVFGWKPGLLRGYGVYALPGRPDGSKEWLLKQLRRCDLEISADHFSVQAPGAYRVRIEDSHLALHLEVDGIPSEWRPGDGPVIPGCGPAVFTRIAMPAPWADVWGTIAVDGESLDVVGSVYTDLTFTV